MFNGFVLCALLLLPAHRMYFSFVPHRNEASVLLSEYRRGEVIIKRNVRSEPREAATTFAGALTFAAVRITCRGRRALLYALFALVNVALICL